MKSYIPGINSLIGPKRQYYYFSSENLGKYLHYWMDKHPCVIQYPNVSYLIFVKINLTLVKKQKNLLQMVQELHNDILLQVSKGVFFAMN